MIVDLIVIWLDDVFGKCFIEIGINGLVIIFEVYFVGVLEMMSCFVVDFCWFIYLLFIMLLVEICQKEGWFEWLEEVFDFY